MKRTASAVWTGSLKAGKGALTVPGGALKNTEYSFGSRFESGAGTNPEELIAAAHAGLLCDGAVRHARRGGLHPGPARRHRRGQPRQRAAGRLDGHQVASRVEGEDSRHRRGEFAELAGKAKAGCPISRLLKAEVTLDATLA
ncbi:MAG: OsmC family peroxiredoxin [Lacunisphaera sp.]